MHLSVCTLYTATVANQRRDDYMLLRVLLPLQVEESQLRLFPHRDRERLTAQLMLDIVDLHIGSEGRLELTCLSTIPGFLAPEQSEYADRKTSSVTGRMQDISCPTCEIKSLAPGTVQVMSCRACQRLTLVTGIVQDTVCLSHQRTSPVICTMQDLVSLNIPERKLTGFFLSSVMTICDLRLPQLVLWKQMHLRLDLMPSGK
jgi:hypothetical protein